MSRELEEELEEIMMQIEELQDHDDIGKVNEGSLMAAEDVIAKVLTRVQHARYLEEWPT